jgi:hypothetical protein
MLFDLNIINYMNQMRKDLFGGFVFFSFLVGFNYALKFFFDELNEESIPIDDLTMKQLFENEKCDEKCDNTNEKCDEKCDDKNTNEKCDEIGDKNTNEKCDEIGDKNTNDNNVEKEKIELLETITSSLENKIEYDISTIQQLLERKEYLINLNQRLLEIKSKLECLKDDLLK